MSEERFEFIRAIVDCGELSWESKLVDNSVVDRMSHDEDVSDYTERQIRELTIGMLDVPEDQVDLIEVIYG